MNRWTAEPDPFSPEYDRLVPVATKALFEAFDGNESGATEYLDTIAKSVLFSHDDMIDYAIEWAAGNTGKMIVEVNNQGKGAVAKIVQRGLERGMSDDEMAALIKKKVGLTDRTVNAVEAYRDGLVAKGVGRGEARRLANAYADRARLNRAQAIASTEVQAALMAGQREMWNVAVQEGVIEKSLVRRKFVTHKDERLCPTCRPLHGKTTTLEGTFGGRKYKLLGPPVHPNCRCYEVLVNTSGRIIKAELSKGDLPGHPFRGNQWTSHMRASWDNDRDRDREIAEFDDLPGDTPVRLYHGTTSDNAKSLLQHGTVKHTPRGDAVSHVAESKSLYVAPTFKDAENYAGPGGSVVAFDVPRSAVKPSPEAGGKTPGRALYHSFEGAVVDAGIFLDNIEEVSKTV